jgi:hypothetical protein
MKTLSYESLQDYASSAVCSYYMKTHQDSETISSLSGSVLMHIILQMSFVLLYLNQ